ncbi:MAG TPA: BatA domain-containing protein [Chitinophagales bacterium]|nr:BatA domain-containing protein [Chitinophagales bacterium]HRK29005.1 BatA domain-containing protein [Chitinophagales bacterium]
MSFLYPSFLLALGAIAIPIIIHLFYFRRFKRVYFTNVKFLRELKDERSSRNKLKHLLVLLSRMLALVFLVLAFAQPYIPTANSKIVQGSKAVSIYLDNSFSMNAGSGVTLFERARRKAEEIAAAYSPDDKFQLITNDFEGKHQRLVNKDEFLAYLEEVSVSPAVQTMSDVQLRQKQALADADVQQKNLFYVSDFQKNIVNLTIDTAYTTYLLPLQSAEGQNVYVDSVWFEQPARTLNEQVQLLVRIKNSGTGAVQNSRMELRINNQTKAVRDFSVEPNAQTTDTLNFSVTETGWQRAEVLITESSTVEFDNTYFFTFEVAERVNVLVINPASGGNAYLNALFKQLTGFMVVNQAENQLDYAKLPTNQLIILNQLRSLSSGLSSELQNYVNSGGSLLIFPSATADLASYNNLLKAMRVNTYTALNKNRRETDFINTRQDVFNDVFERIPQNLDLPFANSSYDLTAFANTGEEILLRFRGGASLVSKYNVGAGKVYLCAVPLDLQSSNLPSHAVFPPMVHKMALLGGKGKVYALIIGKDNNTEVDITATATTAPDEVFKLKGSAEEFIPGQKMVGSKLFLSVNNQLKQAGVYALFKTITQPMAYLGFNYNRTESVLEYESNADLKRRYNQPTVKFLDDTAELTSLVGQIDRGVILWKWCLILSLAFLLAEILLLRFWKTT